MLYNLFMPLYLINPSGALIETDSQESYQKFIKKGFGIPTPQQIEQYERQRAVLHKKMTRSEEKSDIYFCSVSPGSNGFGISAKKIKEAFDEVGVRYSEQQKGQRIGFLYHHPYSVTRLDNKIKIVYTMFESDKIPPEWTEYLKAADLIIVPSHWCMEVFAKAGFSAKVVPLGFDEKVFTPVTRKIKKDTHAPFYFLHYNGFNKRKGFQELWKAFNLEFKKDEPVKLVIKTTRDKLPLPITPAEYPNIIVKTGDTSEERLALLCQQVDAFVFPSMGEGFGMTPLEAMGTGLPTIVPNAHGISEYFNPEYMYEVKHTEGAPAVYSRYKNQDVGHMVVCDVDDLRRQMRFVYEHEKEAKEKGAKAAEYVRQYTFANTAKLLKEIFDEYLAKDLPASEESKQSDNLLMMEEV